MIVFEAVFTSIGLIAQKRPTKITLILLAKVLILYRVAQNHGKQVLRISPIKFHFPIIQFVVIPHGQRDLSSLPWTEEAAVQIS